MKKYFCASDIHSFFNEWLLALNKAGFERNNPDHIIIICGDLFDRGNQSVECYEFIKNMHIEHRLIYVRGNHEDLLFDCISDIKKHRVSYHHESNGTLKTLAQLMNCSTYDLLIGSYDKTKFNDITEELEEFIDTVCVNYLDLNDNVFVHGWIPAYYHVLDYHDASQDDWRRARWENGFDMWRNKNCRPSNKTVIIGHWHCSYGWSHIDKKYEEFPPKNHPDFSKSFSPWIQDGIIGIDACTAYTGKVNVLVFDEQGNLINIIT